MQPASTERSPAAHTDGSRPAGVRDDPAEAPLPSLSHGAFALSLAVVLALFATLNPFWKPLDVAAVDRNIGWSYAPIPLLVGLFLVLEKKRRWGAFFIETMRLTFVKFAITWVAANLYWALAGLPEPVLRPDDLADVELAAGSGVFVERAAPLVHVMDASRVGDLRGTVVDGSGRPLGGALVYVSDGLGTLTYPAPEEPLVIEHASGGFSPGLAVVHAYQTVVLRGGDDLHTAQVVSAGGRVLFTYAMVPGVDKRLMFGRELGLVSLGCTVHGHDEGGSMLAVLSHPFAVFSDAGGRFSLSDVPSGELQLSSWSAGQSGQARVTLAAGETLSVEVSATMTQH